jgi:hypothetical protein
MNDKTDDCTTIPDEKRGATLDSIVDAEKSPSRRRLILSGVLKGSALVAGAVPIKSFASISSITANGKICTISGTQSAAHSQKANLPTCGGLSPGYYTMLSHWPNYNGSAKPPVATNTANGKTFTQNTPFSTVFGSGPSAKLSDIMGIYTNIPKNNDEFHYIAALLNAIKAPSGYVFPYTPTEVINFYNSSQKASALTFFTNYMETI